MKQRRRQAAEKKTRKRPAVKAVVELEWMLAQFSALARKFAPDGVEPNAELFSKWSAKVVDVAGKLASFQSPTLRAIATAAPPPTERVTKFRLRVFETDARGDRREVTPGRIDDEPPLIEHRPAEPEVIEPDVPEQPAEAAAVVVSPPRLPPPSPYSAEPRRPSVQEYADSIASAVGPDGRPRAVNAKAISQAALSRAAMPSTRSAGMPRRSGVFDR